jgi:hypothetical protein
MAVAHTPLPWSVDSQETEMSYGSRVGRTGNVTTYTIVDGKNAVICDTSNSTLATVEEECDEDGVSLWDSQGKANAAFIVTACNLHYELLEALKDCAKYLMQDTVSAQGQVWGRAITAIAKAEGK